MQLVTTSCWGTDITMLPMSLCEGCIRVLANVVLLVVMIGAAYSHHALGDDFEKTMPAVVCAALLTLLLVARKLLHCRETSCFRKSHAKAD